MKLFLSFCLTFIELTQGEGVKVVKDINTKVYAHIMPWFETPTTSGTGSWGTHWTMANRNPNITDVNGRKQIAAYYYPDIEPYASSDPTVIEYQLNTMKYSGIDGVFIDWPGTIDAYDYVKNKKNSEEIIRGTERFDLEFSVIYEDHNVELGFERGNVSNKLEQAQADMIYLRDNYFSKSNYVRVNGQPLLLVFGPQTFIKPQDWYTIFAPFGDRKPILMTLWYQLFQAEPTAKGEYSWIYMDFLDGLRNFYNNHALEMKMGVCYPGFNTFYVEGGWGGPGWSLPTGLETFRHTLDLAIKSNVKWFQIATWNDYGEGSMVEPTKEFGNGFLNMLQQKLGVKYGNKELETIKELYIKRIDYRTNGGNDTALDEVAQLLNDLKPDEAAQLLAKL